jgi:hypothetical protein
LNRICISLCLVALPWGGNTKHHWGSRRNKCQIPHYKSFTLTYLMENKMSVIHHAMERWGCSYTNEDDKGLSERTRWHLMLKPKSKLRWSQGFGFNELDV